MGGLDLGLRQSEAHGVVIPMSKKSQTRPRTKISQISTSKVDPGPSRVHPLLDGVSDSLKGIVPYVPGKPIEETQREYGLKTVVKLASNENPLGPSPRAILAVQKILKQTHRYPDATGHSLRAAIARHLGVVAQRVLLGNGSNDVIDMIVRGFCQPGETMVTSRGAFIAYEISAQVHNVRVWHAPIDQGLKPDLDALLDKIRQDKSVRVVFLANPNNPTGTYLNRRELEGFLAEVEKIRGGRVLVALDSAYAEYVTAPDLPDALEFQNRFSQVIVLYTFSKIYGLAGFRVGYGVGNPELIGILERVRQPFNVNLLGMQAAEAALQDQAFVVRAKKVNQTGLRLWEKSLKRWSIPYWPSQGNFVLVDVQEGLGVSGLHIYHECLKKGLILRPVANYGFNGYLRITVGTATENEFAIRVLEQVQKTL